MKKNYLLVLVSTFIAALFFTFSSVQVSAASDAEVGEYIPGLGTVLEYSEDKPVEDFTEQELINIVEDQELKELIGDGNYYFEDPDTLVIFENNNNDEM